MKKEDAIRLMIVDSIEDKVKFRNEEEKKLFEKACKLSDNNIFVYYIASLMIRDFESVNPMTKEEKDDLLFNYYVNMKDKAKLLMECEIEDICHKDRLDMLEVLQIVIKLRMEV